MLIGLSLSYCVADIVNGLVDRNDVAYIIAGTRIRSKADLDGALAVYSFFYWDKNPELGKVIALDFYHRGLLLQPRLLDNGDGPNVNEGHWAKVGREI